MKKKLAENRNQRAHAVDMVAVSPPISKEGEGQGKWAEPRKQWGEPINTPPSIAQQCNVTGIVREG